jgi:hypothetical protein
MAAIRIALRSVAPFTIFSLLFLISAARGQEEVAATSSPTASAVAGNGARAFPADIQKIIAAGRDGNQAMAHLDYLTNRIGPRLTGSDGLANACEWTRDMFDSFGLANAQLEKWSEWPVGFNRGPWWGRMVAPEKMELEIATDAWTSGTKGKQRGPAILAPRNDEELAAMKDKLAGAWVLSTADAGRGGRGGRGQANRPEGQRGGGPRLEQPTAPPVARPPTEARTNQDTPAEAPSSDRQPAATPQSEAQAEGGQPAGERQGAARRGGNRRGGAINDPFRQKLQAAYREAGVLGTITRRNNDILVTGGRRPTRAEFMDNLPTMPQINMAASSYDAIASRLVAGESVTLEFDIRNYFKRGPIPIHNVVAEIPGRELPDEYVIVGGHIDSWDGATGATDNGTGVATTLEAARILMASGVRPKRTIRFMLWSGEEQGILGSRAYVEAHRDLMPKVSGVLVHDLGTQYLSSISGLSFQLNDLKDVFAPAMALNPSLSFRVRPTDDLTSLGSDHRSFVRAGVPAFFWGQSGEGFNYWDSHHSQHDTFDKAVAEYQEHSSIVIALAAYGIANLDHMLPRQDADVGAEE